jgi:hypothetical protein
MLQRRKDRAISIRLKYFTALSPQDDTKVTIEFIRSKAHFLTGQTKTDAPRLAKTL